MKKKELAIDSLSHHRSYERCATIILGDGYSVDQIVSERNVKAINFDGFEDNVRGFYFCDVEVFTTKNIAGEEIARFRSSRTKRNVSPTTFVGVEITPKGSIIRGIVTAKCSYINIDRRDKVISTKEFKKILQNKKQAQKEETQNARYPTAFVL
jgi:hypothetical protein